jgi:pimeloyl-ACP methyl ester carboxylesterase
MANIVLVHGAWHGGWCHRHTAAALRKMVHEVFTPTHTGVGERAHQAGEDITLETHIRDVAGCIEAEEIKDIILVGHSYGGMLITGLADRMADRIKALVYLDAFVPGPIRITERSVRLRAASCGALPNLPHFPLTKVRLTIRRLCIFWL